MDLKVYQKLCAESKILWTQHCLQRMQERDISRADVKNGIATGEIIEDYPEDYPNPSCLIFGYNVNGRILHIVAGCDNMMPGSKGQKAVHACMIRLLNLGPAKHEVQNIQWMFVLHRPKRSVDSSDLRSKSADFECL